MRAHRHSGFTLIELLVAISILVVVLAITYAAFASVVDSTQNAREAAQEIHIREFLARSFTSNLYQAYEDWRPGAVARETVTTGDGTTVEDEQVYVRYWFEGKDETGVFGPADELSFSSTATMLGGLSLPGIIKQVTYKVERKGAEDDGDLSAIASPDQQEVTLTVRETPIMGRPEDFEAESTLDGLSSSDYSDLAEDAGVKEAVWRFPIRTFDVKYFDGEDWLDDWDSLELERLPWAADIRINFAKTKDELRGDRSAGVDEDEDPDFRMIIDIPSGAGVTTAPPAFDQNLGQGGQGGQGTGQGSTL